MNKYTDPIIINGTQCDGCMRCIFVCPMGVIEMRITPASAKTKTAFVAKPEYCMCCETCLNNCKKGAITLNTLAADPEIISAPDRSFSGKKKRFKLFRKND